MVFFCQRNCYEYKYSTKVVSCKPSKTDDTVNGKKTKINCYEVTFEDTVFFPEGGGQPYDKGWVDDIPVIKVLRKGGDAIHYLTDPLDVGCQVTQVIDWERRHDHMQQHSAQHLITAIADRDYQCATLSWNLGPKVSFIELDIVKLDENQLSDIENKTNEAIRHHRPVSIEEFDAKDPKLKEVRTRGLPEDVVGAVRVVTIEGIDSNMCCGTHVSNLAHLQAVKILYAEKGKAGKTLLYFLAGKRLLSYLGECVSRERELNHLLHSNPSDHARLITKNQKDLKQSLKCVKEAFRDLAAAEAYKFKQISPLPKLFFHHRKDGDSDYLGTIISEINDDSVLKVLTSGEDGNSGVLIIAGPQEKVEAVSRGKHQGQSEGTYNFIWDPNYVPISTGFHRVCDILEGKGGGKTRFTAKIMKPSKRKEAQKFVTELLQSPT